MIVELSSVDMCVFHVRTGTDENTIFNFLFIRLDYFRFDISRSICEMEIFSKRTPTLF